MKKQIEDTCPKCGSTACSHSWELDNETLTPHTDESREQTGHTFKKGDFGATTALLCSECGLSQQAPIHSSGQLHFDQRTQSIRNLGGDKIAELTGLADELLPNIGPLLAAAPQLLQAAKWLLDIWHDEHWATDSETYQTAKAAVDKAEGRND